MQNYWNLYLACILYPYGPVNYRGFRETGQTHKENVRREKLKRYSHTHERTGHARPPPCAQRFYRWSQDVALDGFIFHQIPVVQFVTARTVQDMDFGDNNFLYRVSCFPYGRLSSLKEKKNSHLLNPSTYKFNEFRNKTWQQECMLSWNF